MCEVVSGMFLLGGGRGMDWWEKFSSKLWQATCEVQKPAWRGCAGSLMAEMKLNLHCGGLDKQRHWKQPAKTFAGAQAAIQAFHITVTSLLLQSALSKWTKFRLEANSIVVWLRAGGVSLILPDVRFGTVSQIGSHM